MRAEREKQPTPRCPSFIQRTSYMSTTTLTAPERQAKLETLATFDRITLDGSTVKELRELARGVVTNMTKLNKVEFVDHITDLTADIREANRIALEVAALEVAETRERNMELEAANLTPATPEGYRVALGIEGTNDTIETVKTELDYVARTASDREQLIELVDNIAFKYCFEQRVSYQPTTRKSNATKMYKALDIWLESLSGNHADDDRKTAVVRFKKMMGTLYYQQNIDIAVSYKAKVKTRIDGRRDISAQPLIDRAISELENLSDHRNVAIALAIVTGRRMAEILAVGRFELSSTEGHLLFTGQSKTRGSTAGNSTEVFDIPVLAEPELILKAIEYLDNDSDKYRLETTEEVNKKYSKSLSRKMVEWSTFAGVTMEFKSLRALYASVCFERLATDTDNENSYFASILGHGEKDITTAFSYMVWNIID